jgi:hypothetical protein
VYTGGVTQSSATFHWAPVYGAAYYIVEYRQQGGTWYQHGGQWSSTWAEITGLSSNTTYEWRVKAHCHDGYTSSWSSITYFTTTGQSCGLPFWRYTSPITDTTATFNWAAVAGATDYTVQIRTINGAWQDVPPTPNTGTSATATGLIPNTYYEWQMRVNCNNGAHSNWTSAILFYTGSAPSCGTPSNPYTDNITLHSATLNWGVVSGAVTYSVEFRVLPHGAWNPVPGSPVDTNAVTLDGLSPYTTYEWRVRANCPNGIHSFWTFEVQFTTTNTPPCNAPTGLVTSHITETTATFSWSPVSGAQGYQVQTRLPGGSWVDLPGGAVTDTTVVATGFTPNTTYEWRVRTDCGGGQYSHWSSVASFTTIGMGPGNDNCDNAMLLTVETTCVPTYASNVDASASQPPPVGGCWSNGYKDVWFKFTMPDVANPTVTIRTSAGSLANAVMEVYTGSDCGILSYITCEDNNDNGNGSSMPVINLTGSPNATIWVRIWGYDGSTGTFSICVFDHISINYTGILNSEQPDAGESLDDQLEEFTPVTSDLVETPEVQITPNPVSDQLFVVVKQTDENQVVGLMLTDLSGKTVSVQTAEPNGLHRYQTQLDVSGLLPGMYVLQIRTTSGVIAEKISVVR